MNNKTKPTEKMWRTLVRVTYINSAVENVWFIIPGWDVEEEVPIKKQNIPLKILKTMKIGKRYHVKCNIGAENWRDLLFYFNSWEKK